MENRENAEKRKWTSCCKSSTAFLVVLLFVVNILVTAVAGYFFSNNVYNKYLALEYSKFGGKESYEIVNKAQSLQIKQQIPQIKEYVEKNAAEEQKAGAQTQTGAVQWTNTWAEAPKATSPKSDKPKIDLFIMTYCPYGLQAQKGFLPMLRDFSKVADVNIKFVGYIMHGQKEADENVVQYCIQKEQKDKYVAYLECFLKAEWKWAECQKTAKLDTAKLNVCITKAKTDFKVQEEIDNAQKAGKQYPAFNINWEEAKAFWVQGSPTLVINWTIVEAWRSPKDYKDAICNAFNNQPAECKKEYDSKAFDPMFGFTSNWENNSKAAGCGQ